MNIEFSSLHQINHSTNKWSKIEISSSGDLISQYVQRLLFEISNSGSGRKFVFESEFTEVIVALKNILLNSKRLESAEIILKRLMKVESDSQNDYKHLDMEIPAGSIFQALLRDENGMKRIILSKADHNEFIDDQEFDLRTGLPWKKRTINNLNVSSPE
ncbi:hypothetical protein SAMN03080617_04282 [Algoriphagus alkaliphilus]|uniref:Uncharacterized protein n=1 Tax=Algoriphagus alkaliphilus TaxID=279824 RepID=A0A1G5ZQ35_9BACT|nr:hypothetical protein [Algoriphagus alkaliphilus]SDA96765.1 hypothetical protein SAMN03080617_04282 [Algoriphagus alkaliphilus]